MAYEYEICINLALLTEELKIVLERELQLIQCSSVIIGCLDNLNPYLLWQKDHIFDVCELSPYVT